MYVSGTVEGKSLEKWHKFQCLTFFTIVLVKKIVDRYSLRFLTTPITIQFQSSIPIPPHQQQQQLVWKMLSAHRPPQQNNRPIHPL